MRLTTPALFACLITVASVGCVRWPLVRPTPLPDQEAAEEGEPIPGVSLWREHATLPPEPALRPPWVVVHGALDASCRLIPDASLQGQVARPRRTETLPPWRAVDLHLTSALRVARVAATPLHTHDPVSTQVQLMALDGRRVRPGELHLHLPNLAQRHRLRVYDANGRLRVEALLTLRELFRDHRADIGLVPSPRLVAMLYFIGQHFDAEIEVVSAFRVGGVNATRGSRHASADAADIRIAGVSPQELLRFVESHFRPIGVGIYPNTGFVHVDDRSVSYAWTDASRSGRPSRLRQRRMQHAPEAPDPSQHAPHLTELLLYWAVERRLR